MQIADLSDFNPWWKEVKLIHSDPKIAEYERSTVKWDPRLRKYIDLTGDRVYTLRGPRQVGKTTLIKLMIKDLLEESSVDPRSVLYFTCDTFAGPKEIVEAVRSYRAFTSTLPPKERRFIFIDEVSAVKGWASAVKLLADKGELKGSAVVLTGSHSLDLKRSAERLPGRRGRGGGPLNKILVPMKFAEYVFTLRPDLVGPLSRFHSLKGAERFSVLRRLFDGDIDESIRTDIMLYSKELRQLLDSYLLTGGIVRAMDEHVRDVRISSDTYELYLNALMGDLAKWRFSENTVKRILRSVVEKMTTRTSAKGIADDNGIPSHNTVSNYLDALESSYVVNVLYQVALDDRLPAYRKDSRKVYLADPFIYHAVRGWVKGKTDYFGMATDAIMDKVEKSRLVEMVVADHLIRSSYGMSLSDVFSAHEHLFHHRSKRTGREVDFVMRHGNELLPVEVKYQSMVGRSDRANLYPLRRGVLVTEKDAWTDGSYSALPAECFLMLV